MYIFKHHNIDTHIMYIIPIRRKDGECVSSSITRNLKGFGDMENN